MNDSLNLLIGFAVYFSPTILALSRRKMHPGGVIVVNLFFGWTVIGWIIALAMAASGATAKDVPVALAMAASGPTTGAAIPPSSATVTNRRIGAVVMIGLLIAILLLVRVLAGPTPGIATTNSVTLIDTSVAKATAPNVVNAPVATPASTPHIGTVVRNGNWQYQVVSADTAKTVRTGPYDFQVYTPKGIWVRVTLDLTNVGTRNFSLNSWDLELWDANGIKYDPASFASMMYSDSVNKGHVGDQMPPGVTVRVTLLFDVAPGAPGLKLHPVQGGPDIGLQ
jgi:hypothetical protein